MCRNIQPIRNIAFTALILIGIALTCAEADENVRGATPPDTEANSQSVIHGTVQLLTGPPGTALGFPNELLVAIPILNVGTLGAANVEVRSVRLDSAAPLTPADLPVVLGTVPAQGKAILNVGFDSSRLMQGVLYKMTVDGTYRSGRKTHEFTLHRVISLPPPPIPLNASFASARANLVIGGPFSHTPIRVEERNKEESVPPIPTGNLRGDLRPADVTTSVQALSTGDPSSDLSNPVVFVTNTSLGGNLVNGFPPDMSGASAGNLSFVTYNTSAAISTDGGNTFSILNPTTIFNGAGNRTPGVDGGLCCDQQALYVPQVDRVFWLMQFWATGGDTSGVNKLRIASASPSQLIASVGNSLNPTFWDLTSSTFNLGNGNMDFPSLAYGNNFLYLGVNVPGQGRLTARIPLNQLQAGVTINMNYVITPAGAYPTQNTGDTVYWAQHNCQSCQAGNMAQIRIYLWSENSNLIYPHDVNINDFPDLTTPRMDLFCGTNPYCSIAPNGQNWLASADTFPGEIQGATQRLGPGRRPGELFSNELWFAWAAPAGGAFPNAHIQIVRVDPVDFSLIEQDQIWNPDYAFAYPALTTNSANEVGVAVAWGGGSFDENSAVGIFGDGILYSTGTSDTSGTRWGDFITVRQHFPNTQLYSAETYSTKLGSEGGFEPHYVLFGRSSAVNPPPPAM